MSAKKVYATHLTTPKGDRIYLKGNTREELDEKIRQAKLELGAGVDICNDITFNDYAYAWARRYKSKKIRKNSYATLVCNMENHVIPAFDGMRMRDIKPIHIQEFLDQIAHMSNSSQNKNIQILNGIFRTAVDNGIIFKSPVTSDVKASGERAKEEEPLTSEQACALLSAVKGTRAYLFCLMALSTGLRRGELLGLMWDDIDFQTGFLTVQHNKVFCSNSNKSEVTTLLKSASAYRRIPLSRQLLKALAVEKLASGSEYVFSMADGKSLSKSSFRKLWDIVEVRTATDERPVGTKIAGSKEGPITVTLDFKCHPHQLRHTYITQLFEKGLDLKQVQYLAGHSKPDMTLRVYTHFRRKSREAETADQVREAISYLAV